MTIDLLRALEQDPNRVFYERDLETLPAEEFAQATDKKWLRSVKRGQSYRDAAGRVLATVAVGDGTFEAYDEAEPGANPVILQAADLRRWDVDIVSLAEDMRESNYLSGSAEAIDERLVFVGDTVHDARKLAVILGLFREHSDAVRRLRALPASLPSYDGFLVACPSFVPMPSTRRELESLHMHLVLLGPDHLTVDLAQATKHRPRREPRVILTELEEHEFHTCGFNSRLPTHITGRRKKQKQNIVEIAGQETPISDVPFRFFLRLVVALFETPDGYVYRGGMNSRRGLAAEGYYKPEGLEQATARLRDSFQGALKQLDPIDFIEVRAGMMRLSTHLRYVSWDSGSLSQHHDAKIKKLTMRLDKAARARAARSRPAPTPA